MKNGRLIRIGSTEIIMPIRKINILLVVGVILLLSACSSMDEDKVAFPIMDSNTAYMSDFKGQVVVINFWATWCPPCLTEMPMLETFYQEYHDQNLVVIGVNNRETELNVKRYIDDLNISYGIVLDSYKDIADHYGVFGIPTTIVIDENGEVVSKFIGVFTHEELGEVFDELMAEGD